MHFWGRTWQVSRIGRLKKIKRMDRNMVVKVAMADHFQFKVMPSIKNFCLLKQGDVHYIGGTDILPAPLGASEEQDAIEALGTASDAEAKHTLIEHNLRLVVYIAKKFDNTGVGVEDLISIGTIGLIKAINSFKPDKGIRFATYAAKCIDNELLMMLRSEKKKSREVSIYEPIGTDKEGNQIHLLDIVEHNEPDVVEQMEYDRNVKTLYEILPRVLNRREQIIINLRYGLKTDCPVTQKEIAKSLNISRSYVSRIEKRALEKLKAYFEKGYNY